MISKLSHNSRLQLTNYQFLNTCDPYWDMLLQHLDGQLFLNSKSKWRVITTWGWMLFQSFQLCGKTLQDFNSWMMFEGVFLQEPLWRSYRLLIEESMLVQNLQTWSELKLNFKNMKHIQRSFDLEFVEWC